MTKSPLLLLAEDDKSLSTVTARALRQAGFSVQATDTLSTLWQWLEAGQSARRLSAVKRQRCQAFTLKATSI